MLKEKGARPAGYRDLREQLAEGALAVQQDVVFELARDGDADGLAAQLDAGVPVNLANENGDTLLMLAAYHGHEDAVRALLSRGADPRMETSKGQTPLAAAVFKKEPGIVRALLDAGADPRAGRPSAIEAARMFGAYKFLDWFGEGPKF